MRSSYGEDALKKMKPDELYRAYKDFIVREGSSAQQ